MSPVRHTAATVCAYGNAASVGGTAAMGPVPFQQNRPTSGSTVAAETTGRKSECSPRGGATSVRGRAWAKASAPAAVAGVAGSPVRSGTGWRGLAGRRCRRSGSPRSADRHGVAPGNRALTNPRPDPAGQQFRRGAVEFG